MTNVVCLLPSRARWRRTSGQSSGSEVKERGEGSQQRGPGCTTWKRHESDGFTLSICCNSDSWVRLAFLTLRMLAASSIVIR